MLYDLHIHSCLSPCADDDMTPANIAGLAKLAGADIIAITDHNSALNLPAAQVACNFYGIKLLPGIEVTTQEEIHILCYFKGVQAALKLGEILYDKLIDIPYDENIWGKQLIVNEHDKITGQVKKLLSGPVSMNIYEVLAQCNRLGGIALPAHIEKDSTSIISVLGFLPEDLFFDIIESNNIEKLQKYIDLGFLPNAKEVLISSDAHCLNNIAGNLQTLSLNSALLSLID